MNVLFSKPVTGFTASGVSIVNGVVTSGSFAGSGDVYSFSVTPAADGDITVDIAAAVASDAAGNGNSAAARFVHTFDTTAPTITISQPSLSVADGSQSVTYLVMYNGADNLTLSAADITVNATGSAGGAVSVGRSATSVGIITISNITGFDGTLGITIAANTASDAAGNMAAGFGPSQTFSVSKSSGDFDGNGVDSADALKALCIASGTDTPSASDLAQGDVAPLIDHQPQPDGKIDLDDVVVILRMSVGLVSW